MATPTIGRIVHYHSHWKPADAPVTPPRAAIVTGVHQDGERVSLTILENGGMSFKRQIKYSEAPAPGCWSWPPRV